MSYSFDAENHIHYFDKNPLIGTTTALGIIDKPLQWWASGMAVGEFGWLHKPNGNGEFSENTLERRLESASRNQVAISEMDAGEYLHKLDIAYAAHNTKKVKTADDGVALHAALEQFIQEEIDNTPEPLRQTIDEKISPFVEWSMKNVKQFLFTELHCYETMLWVGGIADFGYIDMEDKFVLGDFKSAKDIYYQNLLQIGGYDIQLMENGGVDKNGKLIMKFRKQFDYHAIFAKRIGLDKPFFNYAVKEAKDGFTNAIGLYKNKMFFDKNVLPKKKW